MATVLDAVAASRLTAKELVEVAHQLKISAVDGDSEDGPDGPTIKAALIACSELASRMSE